ncbi:MAG: aspartate aminotransferase family protein [Oscillospiraceae bacterium]|nr:aspartate aminotransferase family protein [Oscillospiraceae bacterium]
MNSNEIIQRDKEYVANTYGRFPIALTRGKGARCWDADGKEYIDFSSGIGVNSLGFSDPDWAAAVFAQLITLQHTSNLYYTEPGGLLAKTLCERSGMKKVFFANSGAESNEGAIKCARKYGHINRGADCDTIITLEQSFHGRTLAALSATGQHAFHTQFEPFPTGFKYAPPNDLDALNAMVDNNICAIMIEIVQGEGGVLTLDRAYIEGVARLCAERDVLLIVDEVQTGVGRTGTLFAYQQFGVLPDIVTCAKGLCGGLPIGAVLFGEKTADTFAPGDHATTFGANPAVCSGALHVLSRLNDEYLPRVRKLGERVRAQISAMPHVTGVSGLGLMIGATLDGITSREVVNAGIENGVIALTAKDRLRLLPPLNITDAELDEGLHRLEHALRSV